VPSIVHSFAFEMKMTFVRINQECASMDGTQAGSMASIVEPMGGRNTKAERERIDRSSNGTGN